MCVCVCNHTTRMYTCHLCQKSFTRTDSLKRHLKHTHTTVQGPPQIRSDVDHRVPHVPQSVGHRLPNVPQSSSTADYFLSPIPPSQLNISPTCEKHALPWKHPFTCLIAGPTGSGKTSFVKRFLANITEMVTPVPDKITWFYDEYQTTYSEMGNNVDFVQGLPNADTLNPQFKHLIVIDDLMSETNEQVTSIFTKKSHHRNISVIYIVQNVFHQTKDHRNISLNAHYMVLFKNPRDYVQTIKLGHQMFPHRGKDFVEAYRKATFKPYGYLLIDLKQDTEEHLRLRTFVFPGEYQLVFVP